MESHLFYNKDTVSKVLWLDKSTTKAGLHLSSHFSDQSLKGRRKFHSDHSHFCWRRQINMFCVFVMAYPTTFLCFVRRRCTATPVLPDLKNFLEISRDFTFFQDCLKMTRYRVFHKNCNRTQKFAAKKNTLAEIGNTAGVMLEKRRT